MRRRGGKRMVVMVESVVRSMPTSFRPPNAEASRVPLGRATRPVSRIQRRSLASMKTLCTLIKMIWGAGAGGWVARLIAPAARWRILLCGGIWVSRCFALQLGNSVILVHGIRTRRVVRK
jgi:hypothetical protein